MTSLLPCPFCGGEAALHSYAQFGVHWVSCTECKGDTEPSSSSKQAIEAWNKRVERTCKPAKNKHGFLNCCSECGRTLIKTAGVLYNYCPNCGARVEGSE